MPTVMTEWYSSMYSCYMKSTRTVISYTSHQLHSVSRGANVLLNPLNSITNFSLMCVQITGFVGRCRVLFYVSVCVGATLLMLKAQDISKMHEMTVTK